MVKPELALVATDGDLSLRLNLGSKDTEIEGYIGVDRTRGREVFPLDYPDGSCAEIRASHILEHFPHRLVRPVLQHWVDKLQPGGRLRIAVPDFERVARRYLDGHPVPIQDYVMGSQTDENDYHRCAFDAELLTELLLDAGLERIGRWTSEIRDCASLEVSLNLQGFKPLGTATKAEQTAAIVSVPRYGPTSHNRITAAGLHQAGVPYWFGQGAYWHQVISEMMEARVAEGFRYVLTLDYDTVATYADVLQLYRLMEAMPEVDCIAALQMKRHGTDVLFRLLSEEGVARQGGHTVTIPSYQLERNLLPVEAAHFGLTIFRASALAGHPRPWMMPTPDAEGRWSDGKVDADIDFWRRWRAAGRSLYLAPRVRVGHLQEVISWPGRNLQPVYQSVGEYLTDGLPLEVAS